MQHTDLYSLSAHQKPHLESAFLFGSVICSTLFGEQGNRPEYPEAEITTTVSKDHPDSCHSKNIPEPRPDMISGFPNPALATPPEAVFHALPDHEGNNANRAVQLIAGRHHFRAKASVIRRSGTGDAGRKASRVPSLPVFAIHHFRQPAIPDGGR